MHNIRAWTDTFRASGRVFEPVEGDLTAHVTVRFYRSTRTNEAPHRVSFDLDTTTRQKITENHNTTRRLLKKMRGGLTS